MTERRAPQSQTQDTIQPRTEKTIKPGLDTELSMRPSGNAGKETSTKSPSSSARRSPIAIAFEES